MVTAAGRGRSWRPRPRRGPAGWRCWPPVASAGASSPRTPTWTSSSCSTASRTRRGQELAQRILHPLWDARLDAGHAVRSLRRGAGAARQRPDRGHRAAGRALRGRRRGDGGRVPAAPTGTGWRAARPGSFVARLLDEQEKRHSRFGDTIFLLEPDLKSGPGGRARSVRRALGGLRPLRHRRSLRPARPGADVAAAGGGLRDRARLAAEGAHRRCTSRPGGGRISCASTCRRSWRPRSTGTCPSPPGDVRSAVAPAVEALMHDFQRHARTISRETTRLHAAGQRRSRSAGPRETAPARHGRRRPRPTQLRRCATARWRSIDAVGVRAASRRRCSASSQVAIERDLPIGPAHHRPDQRAGRPRRPRRCAAIPSRRPRFLAVLTDVRDEATPSRLEQMNDLGLLAALMPEWEPITGRVQHDVYHVYTVDQHSLYSVAMLKALARREHADGVPLAHRGDGPHPAAGAALPGDAAARRGQGGGQEPLAQGRGAGGGHRRPAGAVAPTTSSGSSSWCAST